MKPFSHHSKSKPAAQTSWDPLAQWYDGWMGQGGSYHHQKIAIPAVLELLQVSEGDQILDLGCGQGVLSEYVREKGGRYTGVDASPRLIELAQQRHKEFGTFLVGNVEHLEKLDLSPESFDASVFLLSLQDMENLEAVFRSAERRTKPGGKLILLLTHPAFRIPRQSGWGWDEGRQLQYRRIDSYMSELAVPLKPYPGQKGVSKSYHRPLQSYFRALKNTGWMVDELRELTGESVLPTQVKKSERRATIEIPLFLAIRARKMS